ncbi:MAG TPA: DUF58 domain-containing protein [Rectinemataceae bacterium]|nr:DUF58 domain-containing protein [Rectinemataceae bacterium]
MRKSPSKPELLLSRVEWTVLRRLDGLLQGDWRSIFKGQGMDLAEIREYQHGDDVRAMDWNVTARLDTPYVRRFDEDRDLTAWFLLDASPSMDFGSAGRRKRESMEELFAALGGLLSRRGNSVGALIYDGLNDEIIPPAAGRRQLLRILEALGRRAPLERSPSTDLGLALRHAHTVITRRSQVFLISDFQSEETWEKALGALALRHDLLAFCLFDWLERELPDLGILFVRDAETGEQRLVDTGDRGFRKRFAAVAQRRHEGMRRILARNGVDSLEISGEDDIVEAVLRFAAARKARSRSARGGFARPLGAMSVEAPPGRATPGGEGRRVTAERRSGA